MSFWNIYDQIDVRLKESLLTIPPYPCISNKKVYELLDSLEKPDPSWGGLEGGVLRLIINPWQRAYQIEYRIKPSKIFNTSRKTIESATFDFMIGNYISSYICLIPVVETILREWAKELEGKVNSKKNNHFNKFIFVDNLVVFLNQQNYKIKDNPSFQEWISRHIQHFELIIKKIFFLKFNDSNRGVKKEFNRNRTLHFLDGIDGPTTIRDNNARIFLLIDIIVELYLAFTPIPYTDNTFYANPETNLDFNLRWNIYLKNALDSVNFTDMNIIRFAFLEDDEKVLLSEERKLKFINQKKLQIDIKLRHNR